MTGREGNPADSFLETLVLELSQAQKGAVEWQRKNWVITEPSAHLISAAALLWVKAQHEGALPPPCIVRKDPRVPHTARRGA